jgi:hypothetical protein
VRRHTGMGLRQAKDYVEVMVSRPDLPAAGAAGQRVSAPGPIASRLAQLEDLRQRGLISARDYEAKKAEILADL